jgi:nucleotide-binding universal stress UspA family protein
MFTLSKIVLPVDFSGRSFGAAQYGKALACRFASELHVVHVLDLRVYGIYGMGNDRAAALTFAIGSQKEAEQELDGFLVDELRNLKIRRVLLYGDPAHEIVKYTAEQEAGMIVLPTHGHGPFRRFLLGSVVAKVLHDSACPVLTGVHMQESPALEAIHFGRILCALDPWNNDRRALQWAWEFAREVGGQLTIVHALPPLYAPDSPYWGEGMKSLAVRQAEQAIQEAQEIVGSKAEVRILAGEAAAEVCNVARESSADLVVISRGVATSIMGRLRSRSYSIIGESPCPVVSL